MYQFIIIERMDTTPAHKSPARLVCPTCRKNFKKGYGYYSHLRVCKPPTGSRAEDGVHPGDDGVEPVVQPPTFDQPPVVRDVYTIVAHQRKLQEEGTLDDDHLLKYAAWGKVELEPHEVEVCKFLRSVETGGGASEAKNRAALAYAKSLGGRGDLLPKTMRTCWKTITKVHLLFIIMYISYSL
jgi:hypothetical protein